MSESSKVTASHLRRQAFIYPRQSSQGQLERNVESTARQYALVERAIELGFTREQIVVIDDDLGVTGDGTVDREGFARLVSEVALGHAGLVLGLECSRVARNNRLSRHRCGQRHATCSSVRWVAPLHPAVKSAAARLAALGPVGPPLDRRAPLHWGATKGCAGRATLPGAGFFRQPDALRVTYSDLAPAGITDVAGPG